MDFRVKAIVIVALLLCAIPASAHVSLIRSSPSANAVLKAPPGEVAIFFSERVKIKENAITVEDANGKRVDQGKATLDRNGRIVRVALPSLGPGQYRVNWLVISGDAHDNKGSFAFHVKQ